MATVRPLHEVHEVGVTTAEAQAEYDQLTALLALVPSEHITAKLRDELSHMSNDLKQMAEGLRMDLKNKKGLGLDVDAWVDEMLEHANDPPTEQDIAEEAENARFHFLTQWVAAMVTVAGRSKTDPDQALLSERLAPVVLPNFWRSVQRMVPLSNDVDNDETVAGFVGNVLKSLPLRLPRNVVVERRADGRLAAAVY